VGARPVRHFLLPKICVVTVAELLAGSRSKLGELATAVFVIDRGGHSALPDERQIRALYRNKEFREMYQEKRRRYGQDFCFKRLARAPAHTLGSREAIFAGCEGRASDGRERE
jgi:hypothetical protein